MGKGGWGWVEVDSGRWISYASFANRLAQYWVVVMGFVSFRASSCPFVILPMHTLLDLLSEVRELDAREAIRSFDGYRTQSHSYRQLYGRIGGCVRLLDGMGFQKGDRLVIWGENRPEWVIAFWACLARGGVVVPLDFHSSPQFVNRVQQEVNASLFVCGDQTDPADLNTPSISMNEIASLGEQDTFEICNAGRDDIVEIVYTSGTTGDPKGVVHRHRHICANLAALESGIDPYRKFLNRVQPFRILNLLPLSHMFGQSLGITIPIMLGSSAVFMQDLHPDAIVETTRRERVSVLVLVPRVLQALQRHVGGIFDLSSLGSTEGSGLLRRCWRFRRVHSVFGWKFWFFVVGGARVDTRMESFWSRLGFGVVQGYGLTEASPVVALNHPFHTRRGSLGKVIKGQEVKIAADGEILVRGESIVSERMSGSGIEQTARDGWLHTGDIGETDAEGRLYYRGRKKEMIVTSEGLNVYPQDVEEALDRLPEVLESAVVGINDHVHAALILSDTNADPEELVQKVNADLESHQRIRSWSLWPEERLPRTPSTLKIRHHEVAQRVTKTGREPDLQTRTDALEGILIRLTGRTEVRDQQRLVEELGLSSLDLVDLLSGLEAIYGVHLDEEAFTGLSTVGELREWLRTVAANEVTAAAKRERPNETVRVSPPGESEPALSWTAPRWPRFPLFRWIGIAKLEGLVFPFLRLPVKLSVRGLQHLHFVKPPVLFAANHTSHLDTPVFLSALPSAWRRRIAPAMMQGYFKAYFQRTRFSLWQRTISAVQYWAACGLFNAFALPAEAVGVRRVLKFMGSLMDQGYCPLVFPEGTRAADGQVQAFRSGIGLMALRLRVPVVPIYIGGLDRILPPGHIWPISGRACVKIGPPLDLSLESDYTSAARRVEAAVRSLGDES